MISGRSFLVVRVFAITFLVTAFCSCEYTSRGEAVPFAPITAESGITWKNQGPFSVAWTDFNRDGLADLWLSEHNTNLALKKPQLYLNQGDGTFADITEGIWSFTKPVDAHGSAWADHDNDGDPDLIITVGANLGRDLTGGSNLFFENRGTALMEIAASIGVSYPLGRGRTPLWFDWDNDGLLDLLILNEKRSDELASNVLFKQQRDGVFLDVSRSAELTTDEIRELAQFSAIYGRWGTVLYKQQNVGSEIFSTGIDPVLQVLVDSPSNRQYRPSYLHDAAIADFNGDLQPDVFLTQSAAHIQMGQSEAVASQDGLTITGYLAGGLDAPAEMSFRSHGAISFDITRFNSDVHIPPSRIFLGDGLVPAKTLPLHLTPDSPEVVSTEQSLPQETGLYIRFSPAESRWTISLVFEQPTPISYYISSSEPVEGLPIAGSVPIDELPSAQLDVLLLSEDGTYRDETEASQLVRPSSCQSIVAGDFDNDMDVDLFLSCGYILYDLPNLYYENMGKGTFRVHAVAPEEFRHSLHHYDYGVGQRAAVADYDNDGFLDIFLTNTSFFGRGETYLGVPPLLLHNTGNNNHWLELELVGKVSNRDGIGARVLVTSGGKTQLREQSGGAHLWAQDSMRVHFGLAQNTDIDTIVVEWPSGINQILTDVKANQILNVTEPSSQ